MPSATDCIAPALTELDEQLSYLRDLCKRLGHERIEVSVRQDGRTSIAVFAGNGWPAIGVVADLHPDSAIPLPSKAIEALEAEAAK